MKILFLIITFWNISFASDKAIHPDPKEPTLISSALIENFKKNLTLPPTLESTLQKHDEAELKDFQKHRTEDECKRAKSEVYVSLQSFYGEPYGFLQKNTVDSLTPFFEQIRNDADFYIQKLKKEFPRQRPFLYIKGLKPCVAKEVTGAYPSGHSTLAHLYALILSDYFPTKKNEIQKRANAIAIDRVLSGMHHPTDIKAGRELAYQLYAEFKKSPTFQKTFDDYLSKISP